MNRLCLIVASIALGGCRSGDAKFDPWEDEEEQDWTDDTASGSEPATDADGDGWDETQDCDDQNAEIHPGATELCDDIDNDCDGDVDEAVLLELYLDADGDGYGLDETVIESCSELPGYESTGGDCDDSRADVYPDADEQCDGLDNDCDGTIDESVLSTWYADSDSDGFGSLDGKLEDCDPPSGYVADGSDCDDSRADVYPDADEWCDGVDNDCDGQTDEDALDTSLYALDADGDGFGDPEQIIESCEPLTGYVLDASDCNDGDGSLHPDADEVCDTVDNDCDGQIDDDDGNLVAESWYGDSDGDGYGGSTFIVIACEPPSNYVENSDDCDDLNVDVHPDASEICNELDDDCDGAIDDDDTSLDTSTTATGYTDADADGFGDPDAIIEACLLPSGATENNSDCDDSDASVNPDAEEECDGIDNDCDGEIDPGFTDTDEDGTPNCVDASVFSDDFTDTDWGEWTTVSVGSGSTSWSRDGNTLSEASDAGDTIAYGPDLGELESYTISVDAWSGGYYNNALGIAFALLDEDNYFLLEWDDFNGFYEDYSPAGEIILWECSAGSCSELDRDDDSVDITMDYATWTSLSLTVDGSTISFSVDGTRVFETSYSGTTPIGADRTGVYSHDNDYGIYFDDFEVTQP